MCAAQSPWGKVGQPESPLNLSDIMSEEVAKGLQHKEELKLSQMIAEKCSTDSQDVKLNVLQELTGGDAFLEQCTSDSVIAKVLQCQFDKEHDEELKLIESKQNGTSKVKVSYDKFRMVPEELIYEEEEDVDYERKDWDRFEMNERAFASLPKCGYKMGADGKVVTKHDTTMNARRNACKVMAFPPEFQTGDAAGFDMQLSNKVYNGLRAHANTIKNRQHKMLDRLESKATAEMGVDEATRLILFKLINNGLLNTVNGIISTGKEAVVLHADCDQSYLEIALPKECAIKVFKTTLNEFKRRSRYIEEDYRFRDHFTKQNPRKFIHMWAEKEMHNLMRIQKLGVNCPEVLSLKKHVLVMSFIGEDHKAAPQLKDAALSNAEWIVAYEEMISIMQTLYQKGRLVHADLSEYNVLWHQNKCWIVDVSQAVEPDHPNALSFLLRDCRNIHKFFSRKGVPDVMTMEELFLHVTGLREIDINLLEGVRSMGNSNPLVGRFEVGPDDARNISYPFEYAWQKTSESINYKKNKNLNQAEEKSDDEFNEMWEKSKDDKPVLS